MKFILSISIVVSVLFASTPGSRIKTGITNEYLSGRQRPTLSFEMMFFSYFLTKEGLGQEILKLHKAGVPLLAGTDPPNLDNNYTDDLLVELQIFSEAGLTNIEVLKTATGKPARFFNLRGVGVVEEGKPSNFLLLNGNPILDLGVLRNIEGIWQRGKLIKY